MRPRCVVAILAAVLVAISVVWLFASLPQNGRGYVLTLRFEKLSGLIVVGAAISTATVLFQTVAANRVLTPSIMGFDSLYILMQTSMIAFLGTIGYATIPAGAKFLSEVVVLCGLGVAIFGTLIRSGSRDIPRTILTGVILGILFRSANSFLTRILDPDTFSAVQSAQYASFNSIEPTVLPWAAAACVGAIVISMGIGRRLDVLALGRSIAVPLGLHYSPMIVCALSLVGVLISVATALVGPITFFGLLVVNLTKGFSGTERHQIRIAVATLIGANILVAGQLVFERVMALHGTLSVVIDFAGGLMFLYLLLKGRSR